MSPAELTRLRGLLPHSDWGESQAIAENLLNEVDRLRAIVTERDAALEDCETVVNETLPDLRLNLEGWQRTAAEATELLRRHVMDWGECDAGPGCACSHAQAVMLLVREGGLDGDPTLPEHPRPAPHGQDKEPDDCEHCEGTGECQGAHPCGYDHSCAVCGGTEAAQMRQAAAQRINRMQSQLRDLRRAVLHEADSIAGRDLIRPEADLCARTLRTAAGQEAS